MRKKLLWITETAIMLALLVTLQWATKPLGQIVTGSCVNAVLAVSALLVGLPGGLTVALLSPVFAFLFGIAPNPIIIPVIMAGNCCFVALVRRYRKDSVVHKVSVMLAAAVAKFAVMYVLVQWVICGALAQPLLEQGVLKTPMLAALPATFGILQLVTALIGGSVALLLVPMLKKALHRK